MEIEKPECVDNQQLPRPLVDPVSLYNRRLTVRIFLSAEFAAAPCSWLREWNDAIFEFGHAPHRAADQAILDEENSEEKFIMPRTIVHVIGDSAVGMGEDPSHKSLLYKYPSERTLSHPWRWTSSKRSTFSI